MNQQQAQLLAEILGGEAWLRGDIWVASVSRSDGSVVVISAEAVVEYESDAELDMGAERTRIGLSNDDDDAG